MDASGPPGRSNFPPPLNGFKTPFCGLVCQRRSQLATVARLAGPGGARSVLAESVLVKQQVLILNRSRRRSPNPRPSDRIVAGLCALLMRPRRLIRSAIVMKPSTLLTLHQALTRRKYRRLFSSGVRKKPGPKGPTQDVIAAVVDLKQRNPTWGCPRIAQQVALAFGIAIDRDVVRRILAVRYQPEPDSCGPSWLTFLGHAKDSLWSIDLLRCESAILRSHWVLLVMDQCSIVRGYQSGASQPALDVIRNPATALNVSADDLLFRNNERGPDDDLKMQFEAVSHFDPDDKNVIRSLLESMILRHEAKRWSGGG